MWPTPAITPFAKSPRPNWSVPLLNRFRCWIDQKGNAAPFCFAVSLFARIAYCRRLKTRGKRPLAEDIHTLDDGSNYMKQTKMRTATALVGVMGTLWTAAAWADSSCGPNSPHYLDPKHKCASVALVKTTGNVGCLNGAEAKYNSSAPAESACTRDDLTAAVCNVPTEYQQDSGPDGLDQCAVKKAGDSYTKFYKPTCKESDAKGYTQNYIFLYKSGPQQTDNRPGKEKLVTNNPVAMPGRDPCKFTAPTTTNVTVMCPSSAVPCPPQRVGLGGR